MKKVLWLTNVRFSEEKIKTSGTWLQPLAEALYNSGKYEIYHITRDKCVQEILQETCRGIKQYVIPIKRNFKKIALQIPDIETCENVKAIVNSINPDLIHVWGTESPWFCMQSMGIFDGHKVLLDVQGVMRACYEFYYGGLTFFHRWQTVGLREIIAPFTSLFYIRWKFGKWGRTEERILRAYDYISVQSEWTKNRLSILQLNANLYHTKRMLRDDFYRVKWKKCEHASPVIFTSSSAAIPYKGFHILVKACAILKKKYPDFVLKIAGAFTKRRLGLRSGYTNYVLRLIKQYNLVSNVQFLGSISSDEIIKHQMESDICVIPSFVESYCLAFAEAMMIGMPCVVAYAGAMPTIAKDKEEAIFFNSMDYVDCAAKIIEVFEKKELMTMISKNGRNRRLQDNDKALVLQTQLLIYEDILVPNKS